MQTAIELTWADLATNSERPVFRRVDDEHPLDLYAGIGANDERTLMLVTSKEPPTPPAYDAIRVLIRRRADGNWALLIELSNKDLATPFTRLCQDLIETTRQSPRDAATVLIGRLGRWRRLLELAERPLPEQALRGLLGELIVLKDEVVPRFGAIAGVNAWIGPCDAPQDFVVGGVAIEVKTIMPTATEITVSSLEQLQSDNPVIVAVVQLTVASQQQPGAFTPAALVEAVRDEIGETSRELFDDRLAETGYLDRPEHHNNWYQCTTKKYYRVVNEFPRLTLTTVPSGVKAAIYDISISQCAPFEILENESWT